MFGALVLMMSVVLANGGRDLRAVESRMDQRCKKYAEHVYDYEFSPDGNRTKLDTCWVVGPHLIIAGGNVAKPREFPHMAVIGYGKNPTRWRCGGSLISERWVLSAAHCTAPLDNFLAKYVLLGDLDITSTTFNGEFDSRPIIYEIVERVNHPKYRRPLAYNDIALYKLNDTVIFNKFVRPICLRVPDELTSPVVKTIASGWGQTGPDDKPSPLLRRADLLLVPRDQCNEAYPATNYDIKRRLNVGVNNDTQICAFGEQADTCPGDSGGPIQTLLDHQHFYCMYAIVGVTSIGFKCAGGTPGIYTRVAAYLPWIEEFVWPEGVVRSSAMG